MYFLQFFFLLSGLFFTKFMNHVQGLRTERMLGGYLTEHNMVPYLVLITGSKGVCSGSILDDYHVLSAAHCFINTSKFPYEWKKKSFFISAGVTDFNKYDTTKLVKATVHKVYVPKVFNESLRNGYSPRVGDIAVLKLGTSLKLSINKHLRAVKLPEKDLVLFEHKLGMVTGYGVNHNQTKVTRRVQVELRFANATILRNTECQLKYDNFYGGHDQKEFNVTEEHICAQVHQRNLSSPEGVCDGDSGGPLMIRGGNVVVGVVSSGLSTCQEDEVPARYTRVTSFLDFIEKARNYDTDGYDDPEILIKQYPQYFNL